MSAKELIAACLDKAKGVLVRTHRLTAAAWEAEQAEAHQEELSSLADYAGNLGLKAVHAAVLDLYAYVGVFAEGPLQPNAAQRGEIERLAQLAETAVLALEDGAHADGAAVYLVSQGAALAPGLEAALHQQGMRLSRFEDRESFAAALRARLPRAILVQAELTGTASELLDGLASSDASQIPLVAFADGGPAARLGALLAGADLYVESLDGAGIAAQLRELLASQNAAPYRVLVVDDDRQMCIYCEAVLGRAGMQVQSTQDPAAVLSGVQSFKPDLVLMDLYLAAGADGLSLTAELRQHKDAVVLPIVFLSGEQNEEVRYRAIKAGGDDYLTKPIRPRHLVAAVRSRIKRVRALGRQLVRQPGDAQGHLRRGAFLEHLRNLLKQPPSQPVALLVVTLDQAEELQESLSLSNAHELEQAIAWRLTGEFGGEDRYGLIQEFGFGLAVVRAQRNELMPFAASLCRAVSEQPFKVDGKDRTLTVSVGLAVLPRGGSGVDSWINSAFAAARSASRMGGNRVDGLLADAESGLSPERLMRIRELLRVVADRRVLAIDYQPLIPLRGSDSGRYALQVRLRDRREAFGGIERREFVPVAREGGRQLPIDRDVVQRALHALHDQRSRNRVTDLMVPIDFATTDAEQVAWIAAAWKRSGLRDQHLTLEFDAAALLEDTQAGRTLARLQAQGLRLSAALSSAIRLPLLFKLPLHVVRIPAAELLSLPGDVVDPALGQWSRGGRALVVDEVHDLGSVARFWSLGVDYLMGDNIAAAGPRPDFDFSEINLA